MADSQVNGGGAAEFLYSTRVLVRPLLPLAPLLRSAVARLSLANAAANANAAKAGSGGGPPLAATAALQLSSLFAPVVPSPTSSAGATSSGDAAATQRELAAVLSGAMGVHVR